MRIALTFIVLFYVYFHSGQTPSPANDAKKLGDAAQVDGSPTLGRFETIADKDAKPTPPPYKRFALSEGVRCYTDRNAVVEIKSVKGTGDEKALLYKELMDRLAQDGRMITLEKAHAVRLVAQETALGGWCEVFAEEASDLKTPHFWVGNGFLKTEKDLFGSKTLTGYMIFRGHEGTVFGPNEDIAIHYLSEALSAAYSGTIPDEELASLVFMPAARCDEANGDTIEPVSVVEKFVIYEVFRQGAPSLQERLAFAVPRNGGERDSMGPNPLRIGGRHIFSMTNGSVMNLLVVVPQKVD